jgi:hypothetical protein
MTTGSSIQSTIRTAPPQAGQISISMPQTNFQWQVYVWLQQLIRSR